MPTLSLDQIVRNVPSLSCCQSSSSWLNPQSIVEFEATLKCAIEDVAQWEYLIATCRAPYKATMFETGGMAFVNDMVHRMLALRNFVLIAGVRAAWSTTSAGAPDLPSLADVSRCIRESMQLHIELKNCMLSLAGVRRFRLLEHNTDTRSVELFAELLLGLTTSSATTSHLSEQPFDWNQILSDLKHHKDWPSSAQLALERAVLCLQVAQLQVRTLQAA